MDLSERTKALGLAPGGEKCTSVIALRGVSKVYYLGKRTPVPAVQEVSLEVAKREFVVITGRSGSGKTTLLNLAAGLARPTAGQVLIEGVDLWTLNDGQQALLRQRMLGFIFQFPSLLPSLTALENVVLPTAFGRRVGGAEAYDRAASLLSQLGLGDKLRAYPRQLSAGQQKRVVIARALINEPSILLADEPTSDLDEETEREFMALLQGIYEGNRLTILLVTHNRGLVPYASRHVQMAAGRIVVDSCEPERR